MACQAINIIIIFYNWQNVLQTNTVLKSQNFKENTCVSVWPTLRKPVVVFFFYEPIKLWNWHYYIQYLWAIHRITIKCKQVVPPQNNTSSWVNVSGWLGYSKKHWSDTKRHTVTPFRNSTSLCLITDSYLHDFFSQKEHTRFWNIIFFVFVWVTCCSSCTIAA